VRRNDGPSSSFSGSTKRLNEQVSATDQDFQMISILVVRRGSSIFQAQFATSKKGSSGKDCGYVHDTERK